MIGASSANKTTARLRNYDFGDYDRCLKVHHESEHYGTINGQHCMYQFIKKSNQTSLNVGKISFNMYSWKLLSERFGDAICLPLTCSPNVVTKLLEIALNGSEFEIANDYDQNLFCKSSKLPENSLMKLVIFGCLLFGLLICVTSSSIYDFVTRNYEEKKRSQFLMSFSVIKNASNLFNVNKSQSTDTIEFLDCIRFISSAGIVFIHTHFYRALFPVQHPEETAKFLTNTYGRFVNLFTTFVDTFFVLSGMLLTRSLLKSLDT